MSVIVHPDARRLGIVEPVSCRLTLLSCDTVEDALDVEAKNLTSYLREGSHDLINSPVAAGFRELFRELGYANQVPAGERLVKLIVKRGLKRHGTLVDAYNIVSAKYACGIGMHRGDRIKQHISVRRAVAGDTITPLFKTVSEPVTAGDLVYTTGELEGDCKERVVAWLGEKDVDSDDFKVDSDVESVVVVVLGNAKTSREFNRAICDEIVLTLRGAGYTIGVDFLGTVFK